MISVISPVYNEADNLVELCERLTTALQSVQEEYEIILVENGSSDGSLEIIKSLREKNTHIKYLSLSRNFGHQGAILAGLNYAVGDAVISIDGDLQQPPELIPKLIELWKKGNEVVFTTKKIDREHSDWRFYPMRIFYKLINMLSDIKLSFGQSDFRLLDRKVVEVIKQIPEKNKFIRGMVKWVGFSQTGVEYEVSPRKTGESKFSFRNYVDFAFDGIFSFSIVPLKLFLWVGILIFALCGFYALIYVVLGVVDLISTQRVYLPSGQASIIVSILFLGGVQLIGIGVLGEYIGRIYSQTKERPDFIVKEKGL